jgi:hypothetical protein
LLSITTPERYGASPVRRRNEPAPSQVPRSRGHLRQEEGNKTWCNFLCPVFTIELLYTEGDRPQYQRNSQCPGCTGCKTVPSGGLCPDINQENDYWQEIKLPARAFSYYAFPGLVLGFYLWYFLHQPSY